MDIFYKKTDFLILNPIFLTSKHNSPYAEFRYYNDHGCSDFLTYFDHAYPPRGF